MLDLENKNAHQFQLLWGATAIAQALGVSRRQAFHLLEQGKVPARKVGGRWVAELHTLHQFFGQASVDA